MSQYRHQTTIIDIAKALHISKSTVSRALTGHPNVNPGTRKAVLELAEKLDYQRNMLAISLVTSRSHTLGVIVPEFVTSFFPQIIISAQEVARQAGYNVIISQSDESYETEVANARVMLANRVDGVMVSLTKETRNFDHFKVFQRKGIPIVFFNRVCDEMQVPKVVVDDYEGAFRAVEHLIGTGKRRIAHLAGPDALLISRKRLQGYRDALRKHGLPIVEDLIIPYDLTAEKARIYVKHLLDLAEPPDGLFAINDPTAIEAIRVIKAKGLRIPGDIGVVGFSNDYASALIEPGLTTIAQPMREIGKAAVQLLLEQMEREPTEWKAVTRILPTELVVRGSSTPQQ
jgi:LacI family transcriptional regulator/LacI family repressor for deo operon, udp, cdd, tsx, nupC, and nupG